VLNPVQVKLVLYFSFNKKQYTVNYQGKPCFCLFALTSNTTLLSINNLKSKILCFYTQSEMIFGKK